MSQRRYCPYFDKPLIQYAVDDAIEAGITDIAIVEDTRPVGSYFHSMPDLEGKLREGGRDELADQMVEISSSAPHHIDQTDRTPRIRFTPFSWRKNFIGDEPFAVLLPDEILWGDHSSTAQVLDVRDRYGGNVIAVTETSWDDVHTKGIVAGPSVEPNVIAIEEMVEKPKREDAPSNLAIIGRYAPRANRLRLLEPTAPWRGRAKSNSLMPSSTVWTTFQRTVLSSMLHATTRVSQKACSVRLCTKPPKIRLCAK